MAKTKIQKQDAFNNLKEKLSQQKACVFIDFSGVEAKSLFELRNNLKAEGCNIIVTKKTIFKKALNALGKNDLAKHIDEIKGQLALTFGFFDEIAPSRICFNAQKGNQEIKILGGVLAGQYQTQDKVLALAQLPTKQELLGQLLGSLNAPVSGFVNVLKENLKNLVCVINEIQKVRS